MIREPADTIERTEDARRAAEAADQVAMVGQPERHDDPARPVRYLWPALSSLWQAPAR